MAKLKNLIVKIDARLNNIERVVGGFNKIERSLEKTTRATKKAAVQGDNIKRKWREVSDAGRVTTSTMGHYDKQNRKVTDSITKTTMAHARFKMHLLSVMFFGMAIQRVFGGWISKVLQMTGIMDLLSAVMTMLLLPVLIPLIPLIVDLASWMLNLGEGTRRFIGLGMVMVTILGFMLFVIGTIGLGIQGLKIFFTELAGVSIIKTILSGGVSAVLSTLGVVLLTVSAALFFVYAVLIGIPRSAKAVYNSLVDLSKMDMTGNALYDSLIKLSWLIVGIIDNLDKITTGEGLRELMGKSLAITRGSWLSFQHGGRVPGSGPVPIMAHGGETVLPAGVSSVSYSPVYHINANLSGGMDVEAMVEEIRRVDIDSLKRHLMR